MASKKILSLVLTLSLLSSSSVQAEPMKEFLVSCAYGMLAGTLVGTATMALSEDPDSNYNNVAKGASLGLYAGIILGSYLVLAKPQGTRRAELAAESPLIALTPHFKKETGKLDGLSIGYEVFRF